MASPEIEIKRLDTEKIEGQTCGRIESKGRADRYSIRGRYGSDFSCVLLYQQWDNGEKDIKCIFATGSPVLTTILGRMRLTIQEDEKGEKEYATLKTAQIKTHLPPHATLRQKPASFYQDHLGFDLEKFLSGFGEMEFGAREMILDDTGKQKNQLSIKYKSGSREIPLAAFVATRIFPLLVFK